MIISLMHIHLAENVKLTSRRVDFRPFSVKTPREAGRGDEKKTPESKSINNVTD